MNIETGTSARRPLNIAEIVEAMADAVPDRIAVVTADRSYTFAELDERSTRLAQHLVALGVKVGEHVAVHASNRVEWVEAFYGCFKARLVPINVNYRFLRDELTHVYNDADCVAAIVAPEYVDAIAELTLPQLRHVLVMGDRYEAALASASTQRLDGRSPDDLYMLYTGGTTGLPKGVMWRQEDIILAALNAARRGAPIESVEQLANVAAANDATPVMMACAPLMHGGSQWILGNALLVGATTALYTHATFDPALVLDLVEQSGANSVPVIGDAMGRPLAEAALANPGRWDLSRLFAIANGAAPLSEGVRQQLREAFPGRFITDGYGASESGATGAQVDDGGATGGPPRFGVGADVEVFDTDMRPCAPGVEGMLARRGSIPLGYYKDAVKTAATFKVIDGVRWSIPGDAARRELDGTVSVLGRGSVSINTGGEKVHPEEVEAVLLRHDDVADAAVVGIPHERWGQQITAVVQLRQGATAGAVELDRHVRAHLAGYKVPKQFFFVDKVPRTPVSKVDYPANTKLALALSQASA